MEINSSLFPFQESKFCSWVIIHDFLRAPSYPKYIHVITVNIQYYSPKSHSKVAMTYAPNNAQTEPQTAPRRLA